MTLKELIQKASDAYDADGIVMRYFEEPDEHHGDTLALFVMRELSETFDAAASKDEQLNEAIRVMSNARDELEKVLKALEV